MKLTVDKFCPGDNLILATRVPPDSQTAGGIVVPDAAKAVRNWALVVHSREMYSVGTAVAFPAYAAKTIEFDDQPDGVEYLLIQADSILGHINPG